MRRGLSLCLGLLLLAGCGGESGLVPTKGIVTLDGEPLAGATVLFRPTGETRGQGGAAITGADGSYEVKSPRGNAGLTPGTYSVVVSRLLRPDGSPPPPDVPPIESDARETLPARYSDPTHTTLTTQVEAAGNPVDFQLQSGKKR